jgi:hypothetical protein
MPAELVPAFVHRDVAAVEWVGAPVHGVDVDDCADEPRHLIRLVDAPGSEVGREQVHGDRLLGRPDEDAPRVVLGQRFVDVGEVDVVLLVVGVPQLDQPAGVLDESGDGIRSKEAVQLDGAVAAERLTAGVDELATASG